MARTSPASPLKVNVMMFSDSFAKNGSLFLTCEPSMVRIMVGMRLDTMVSGLGIHPPAHDNIGDLAKETAFWTQWYSPGENL